MNRSDGMIRKLMVTIASLAAAILLISGSIIFISGMRRISATMNEQKRFLVGRISKNLSQAVYEYNTLVIRDIIHAEMSDPVIRGIAVYDESNHVLIYGAIRRDGAITELHTGLPSDESLYSLPITSPLDGSVIGKLIVSRDYNHARRELFRDLGISLAGIMTIILILSAVLFIIIRRNIIDPLQILHGTMSRISAEGFAAYMRSGNDSSALNVFSERGRAYAEILDLGTIFSSMIATLSDQHGKLLEREDRFRQLSISLEQKVRERTAELEYANTELSAANADLDRTLTGLRNAQEQLVLAGKMATLGRLVAGIAHEINTPLGAITASASSILRIFAEKGNPIFDDYAALTGNEQKLFRDLLGHFESAFQTEYLSRDERKKRRALAAELNAAGVSDAENTAMEITDMGLYSITPELLNTLSGPRGQLFRKTLWRASVLYKSTRIIHSSAERASGVISALRSYSHTGSTQELEPVNLREEIETLLKLYYSRTKHSVIISTSYCDEPIVHAFSDELNQVWVNLINNALYAMNYKGTLDIRITRSGEFIIATITDNGCGIPDELKDRIFEPFFTTKPAGEGSGLGLDIARKILQRIGGSISFESEPGRTTFTVALRGQAIHESDRN